jgi:hypothetical protein
LKTTVPGVPEAAVETAHRSVPEAPPSRLRVTDSMASRVAVVRYPKPRVESDEVKAAEVDPIRRV